jgi:hypothetical protein
MVSGQPLKTTSANGSSVQTAVITSASNPTGIAQTLFELATYNLLRARYESRGGSASLYFNPYIVPGFPMVSIEGSSASSLNVYAYVTDVTHQITERLWTTQVGFTATHIGTEPRPPAFPIVEQDYVKYIDDTYTRMLGSGVTRVVGTTAVNNLRNDYIASDGSVTSMLKKVWRPLTTMDEHLKDVCDGATVVQERGYKWLKNGTNSTFFDADTQAKIKGYTQDIMDGVALYNTDVR